MVIPKDRRKDLIKTHHKPIRSCVACGTKNLKADLIRVSTSRKDILEIGPTVKQKGRGIYLCRSSKCWDPEAYKNGFEKGLHTVVSDCAKELLLKYYKENLDLQSGGDA